MRRASRKIFRELLISLGAMVAAVLAVAVIVWINIGCMQVADAEDREAHEEVGQDAAVIEAAIDQETGFRGMVTTRDADFLALYRDGQGRLDIAMRRLTVMAADDPLVMRQRVADIARQARTWRETVAEPQIAAAEDDLPLAHDSPTGKAQMAAIRADIAALRQDEEELLAERDRLQAQTFSTSRLALVLGSAFALVFGLLIAGRSFARLIADRREAEAASRRLEGALERAQAAERAKTVFLSNMSHEMRTPLNGVAGMAQALALSGLQPNQREMVAVIASSATALDRLIGDLLSLSRDDAPETQPASRRAFHLGRAVRNVAEAHRAAAEFKGLTLQTSVAPEAEVDLVGDTVRLKQLAACILSNAIKFTDRGHVSLAVERLSGQRFRFEIADTGIGFDEAHKAQLFETFAQSDDSATRRHGGAGLGLALAQRLAAELGGRLDAHSTPGEGSSFTFEIELEAANAASSIDPPPIVGGAVAAPDEDDALRALIVDDNPTNRAVLQLILDQLGVTWVSVEDGQQAVDAAARQDFSVILMDIQMPVMDGLTATREIRRLEREGGRAATPVIIVSANGQPEHVQAGRAAGAQVHLTKPVSAQALVDALNGVLADHAEARAA